MRVEPEAQWETWQPVASISQTSGIEYLARALLTNDKIIKSVPRVLLAQAGYVP